MVSIYGLGDAIGKYTKLFLPERELDSAKEKEVAFLIWKTYLISGNNNRFGFLLHVRYYNRVYSISVAAD